MANVSQLLPSLGEGSGSAFIRPSERPEVGGVVYEES
jgi:hypothetical protein